VTDASAVFLVPPGGRAEQCLTAFFFAFLFSSDTNIPLIQGGWAQSELLLLLLLLQHVQLPT
jgi:hypothetical protein